MANVVLNKVTRVKKQTRTVFLITSDNLQLKTVPNVDQKLLEIVAIKMIISDSIKPIFLN